MKTFKILMLITLVGSMNLLKAQENNTHKSSVSFVRKDVDVFDGATDVWVTDINNDGNNDIIASSYNNGISWWKNDGNQNFTKKIIATAIPENSARTLRVTKSDGSKLDFNNDNYVDMISAMGNTHQIAYWMNDGLGNFTKTIIDTVSYGAHTVDAVDLDNDGDIDILASSFGTDTKNGEFAIYYNNGNLQFTKNVLNTLFTTAGTFIHAGNIDNDSNLEIIFTEWHWQTPSKVGIYNKTLNGWERTVIDSCVGMHTALLKDFDKDGDLDLLAAAWNGSYYFLYSNDGSGKYTKAWEKSAFKAIWLDMADFDNDGDNDLLGIAQNPGVSPDLYWYENKGNYNFTTNALSTDIVHVYSGIPADIDKDGDIDIVIAANESDKIIWFENKLIYNTSLKKNDKEILDIVIFPNPTNNQVSININSPINQKIEIKIFNSMGIEVETLNNQLIYSGKNKIELNTTNLNSGIYYCKINNNQTAKFIIEK